MRNIREEIENELKKIEETEHVKILLAVESGSRCWGVESPDSDYDVRFVYVHDKNYYLQLQEHKDIIEWQLDEVLDINGWDLDKTLRQIHKGNAAVFEWLNSSIVYKNTKEWEEIVPLLKSYFSKKVAIHHYNGTAKSTFLKYLQESDVRYKKYIYALRPLLACTYIENYQQIPPVLFRELTEKCLPEELEEPVRKMLEIKAQTDEKVLNPQIPEIIHYIEERIQYYESEFKMEDDRNPDWEVLNQIFLKLICNN